MPRAVVGRQVVGRELQLGILVGRLHVIGGDRRVVPAVFHSVVVGVQVAIVRQSVAIAVNIAFRRVAQRVIVRIQVQIVRNAVAVRVHRALVFIGNAVAVRIVVNPVPLRVAVRIARQLRRVLNSVVVRIQIKIIGRIVSIGIARRCRTPPFGGIRDAVAIGVVGFDGDLHLFGVLAPSSSVTQQCNREG